MKEFPRLGVTPFGTEPGSDGSDRVGATIDTDLLPFTGTSDNSSLWKAAYRDTEVFTVSGEKEGGETEREEGKRRLVCFVCVCFFCFFVSLTGSSWVE